MRHQTPAEIQAAYERATDAAKRFNEAVSHTLDKCGAFLYEGIPGEVIIEVDAVDLNRLSDLVEEHWV